MFVSLESLRLLENVSSQWILKKKKIWKCCGCHLCSFINVTIHTQGKKKNREKKFTKNKIQQGEWKIVLLCFLCLLCYSVKKKVKLKQPFFIYFIFIFSVLFFLLLKPSMYYTTFKVLKVNFLLYDEVCIFLFFFICRATTNDNNKKQQQRTIFIFISKQNKKKGDERSKLNCWDTIEQKHSMNFIIFCGWLSIT